MIVSVIAAEALLHNTIPKEHKVKREFLFGFTDFICSGLSTIFRILSKDWRKKI
ncbi:hypothetical protein [Wolbachia endosymbiont (group A) of Ischnus inquisitorius]|uniref:hypothetical protein n=1 Tax=Wolbachia endosymbiont (group A) of Ischnus inquisitorius TaxID=3077922 RepID=UPI00313323C5